MPPTGRVWPRRLVLDLSAADFTPAALEELIVPLGQRLLAGDAGDVAGVVFATPDVALQRAIVALANRHSFPFFIARSGQPDDVKDALPAAELTSAEMETLEEIARLGGHATAADLASSLSLEPPAVNNRLTNLTRRGLIYRVERNRRQGAEYVDPRHLDASVFLTHAARPEMRSALRSAGIDTDPYDTTPVVLEGEAAERAAELLRRRGGDT